MRPLVRSRRAIVATTAGLVLSLSLAACSQLVAEAPTDAVGCSLLQHHGDLLAENGRVVFEYTQGGGAVPVDWPGDWTTRPTDGGHLEVVSSGIVFARTGTRVILATPWDPDGPVCNSDGEFVACGPASPG